MKVNSDMKTLLRPSGEQYFLKDALRDLVVVVVGILAALYLESWWQDRQDRAEEAQLLSGLREEFIANRAQLQQNLAFWSESFRTLNQARQFMDGNASEMDTGQVINLFWGPDGPPFFDPRTGQLKSLISSGKLGLIENADLRANLADWPDLVADLDIEREIALHVVVSGYIRRLSLYFALPERSIETRLGEMLADKELYVDLNLTRSNLGRSFDEGEIILQATDYIIALIDRELE
jgi:type II secretory pathway pseudopilin PulG